MYAIEFKTRIKNGIIDITNEYRDELEEDVKVMILKEEKKEETNMIDQLLDTPVKIKKFKPFSREKIYEQE